MFYISIAYRFVIHPDTTELHSILDYITLSSDTAMSLNGTGFFYSSLTPNQIRPKEPRLITMYLLVITEQDTFLTVRSLTHSRS
jgi:hypothetical protein